ncbi:MAG TPA: DJ-1/PfpI family protein [Candidatus Dormibacteraeota bacterium]|jgi:transcriptional regulator GlxA family with amidase domain|nr:DJ-1/PfpI family protein [Candidatus Dormibacteraeota bacterium]
MRIAIVLYQGFDELDAIAPFEVFRHASRHGADIDVKLVTLDGAEEVTASGGLRIHPDGLLSGRPDLVLVPGGRWGDRSAPGARAEVMRGDLPQRLRELKADGAIMATVCTGAMLAAAAGLTAGRPATTHHSALDDLRASGARVIDARVVDDGDLITAGGITSGLDLALWIVEREFGSKLANEVAETMEYRRTGDVWNADPEARRPA